MPSKTLFIVQQFERQGKKLVAGRAIEVGSADAAVLRAERGAERYAGVVALTQTIDADTGEVMEEPVILARHGDLPTEFLADCSQWLVVPPCCFRRVQRLGSHASRQRAVHAQGGSGYRLAF